MRVERLEEFALPHDIAEEVKDLLAESFPAYPQKRTYFRQVPSFRFLAWEGDTLAAHMGVDFRVMNNDGQVIRTFGIVDLCVRREFRHQGIAADLIDRLEKLGRNHAVDFIILWARDRDFYRKRGFEEVQNSCRWLLVQNHQSHGLVHRRFGEGLMVLRLGDKTWRPGTLDYLGHIF